MEVKEIQDNELQKALDTLEGLGLDIKLDDEDVEKAKEVEIKTEGEEKPEGEESKEGEDEDEEEKSKEVKKSEEINLLKSVESMIGGLTEKLTNSFDEKFKSLQAEVDKIGSAPNGRKSSTTLEKGEGDEFSKGDTTEISWGTSKEGILGFMGGVFEKANASGDNATANMYSDEILKCNAGGGFPSKEVLTDLYTNHKVKVIK